MVTILQGAVLKMADLVSQEKTTEITSSIKNNKFLDTIAEQIMTNVVDDIPMAPKAFTTLLETGRVNTHSSSKEYIKTTEPIAESPKSKMGIIPHEVQAEEQAPSPEEDYQFRMR